MDPTKNEQRITESPSLGAGWTQFEVATLDYSGRTDSRTRIRAHEDHPFVDIGIEEYTGETRRAKYTSVRLGEAAARKLYEALGRSLSKGVALVPVEPTLEMLNAGQHSTCVEPTPTECQRIYRAMLAAAPKVA